MTTITATLQPATASVALTVTPTASVTGILRTDANGIHTVRTVAGLLPTSGAFVVVDNEATLSGTVTYNVVSTAPASVTTDLGLVDAVWLTVPVTPVKSQAVELLTNDAPTRQSLATVHDIIDRPDPVLTLAPLGLRKGTLDILCRTYADARKFEDVYGSGEVVQLRQSVPGIDMYHVGIRTAPAVQEAGSPPRWVLTVEYVEVAWPAGAQVGTLGWDVDDVTAAFATVNAVTLRFPTVNDLTIGL